ncbi:Scr1 family TA system antitoxin-like transcriptional regulator [Streptomyces netropsis]|uniref:DUF5753 domain-containing protein n=1 Tax=Streptomyces netropsis TaxID=55404 RepID=A0A7W7PIQ2_STRNE|nr:hypothetical protein [Streptomyces netropsis]
MGGSLTLLTLPNRREALYTEGIRSGGINEEPEDVAKYSALYDRIQANALSPDTTAELICEVMEEQYPCTPSDPV